MSYSIHSAEEMLENLSKAYKEKRGFAVSCLGDGEQIFLACPEIENTPYLSSYLKLSGITPEMKKLKEDCVNLLPTNDYIFTHAWSNPETDPRMGTPAEDWARFFYKSPEIINYYKMEGVKLITDLPKRYEMVVNGSLLEAISGAKVLLVGFHAPEVERRCKIKEFVDHYENMGVKKITIVGSLGCSEGANAGEEVYSMIEKAKGIDFDVALVGMGVTSLCFIPKIKTLGKIAINIGHSMSAFAGKGDINRMYMDKFNY
jgi:hypothetical protein